MTFDDKAYIGREQSKIKHFILRNYLRDFGHKIGSKWDSITYVDGFSGPWNDASNDLSDSSFAIALNELRNARETYQRQGRNLRLRCVFLEKNKQAFSQLKQYADDIRDVEIFTKNNSFGNSIKDVLNFIAKDKNTFPFIFIDPMGWTGYAMDVIAPLIRQEPCEVLINFMTDFIGRFIDGSESLGSFIRLFGSTDFRDRIAGLEPAGRIDAIVDEYCRQLRDKGNYHYTCPAIVLRPDKARTHYHLIYATRHYKGVTTVFKNVEKRAMATQEAARARVEQTKRELGGQRDLLFSDEPPPSEYYRELRQRYLDKATDFWLSQLQINNQLAYDNAWEFGMALPMVWESDLKDWIKLKDHPKIAIEGLAPGEKTAKFGKGHLLVWDE